MDYVTVGPHPDHSDDDDLSANVTVVHVYTAEKACFCTGSRWHKAVDQMLTEAPCVSVVPLTVDQDARDPTYCLSRNYDDDEIDYIRRRLREDYQPWYDGEWLIASFDHTGALVTACASSSSYARNKHRYTSPTAVHAYKINTIVPRSTGYVGPDVPESFGKHLGSAQ